MTRPCSTPSTGAVARITLNRPERGNGITRELIEELERCVERADLDPAVHVLLLAGNGKGFCGGYDLVESAEGRARAEAPATRTDGAGRVAAGSRGDDAPTTIPARSGTRWSTTR